MRAVDRTDWALSLEFGGGAQQKGAVACWHGRSVEISRVEARDVGSVLAVLDEVAERLDSRGVRQWPRRFQPSWVTPAIEEGLVCSAPTTRRSCNDAGVATPDLFLSQANSFGSAAQEYERSRPSYPLAAIDWLVPRAARRVLDLGAGTGQLTRQLAQRALNIVAVEPSEGMREELVKVLPEVLALAGSAEQIPLDDGAVDVVLVAQAWHWVDVSRAVPEVARVLSPTGRLGLLWNIRDEREEWVARLGKIMHRGIEQAMNSSSPQIGQPFGSIERFDVEWTYHLTKGALIDLVASRSYVITLPAQERAVLLSRVRDLIDTHPALAGRDEITMPYLTQCTRADLA